MGHRHECAACLTVNDFIVPWGGKPVVMAHGACEKHPWERCWRDAESLSADQIMGVIKELAEPSSDNQAEANR